MSVIHDGIVADTPMIDNPMIAENLRRYYEGSLSYKGLTDIVVDTYMDAVIENSVQGQAAGQKLEDEKYKRSSRQSVGGWSSLQKVAPDYAFDEELGEEINLNAHLKEQTKRDGSRRVYDSRKNKIFDYDPQGNLIKTTDIKYTK